MVNARDIKLVDIKVRGRLRKVDPDYVDVLATSIDECGRVQQPITVHEDKRTKVLSLVAGAHRLAAAKMAGLDTIPATVLKGKTKDELRLLEIDENLIRHELNALDRAAFLAERKDVYERLHPETQHGGDRKSPDFKNQKDIMSFWSFAENTAEKLGVDRKTVDRAVGLHKRLSPEVRKMLAGTELARNQAELIKLSKLSPDTQLKVAWIILDEGNEANKVGPARAMLDGSTPTPDHNSGEAKVRRAYESFTRLSAREQDRVLGMIGEARLFEFIHKKSNPNLKVAD